MGLRDNIQKEVYEMFTSESYENSNLAKADAQKKAMKQQSSVVNKTAQGFSTGVQSRIYGNPAMTGRPLPTSPDNMDYDDEAELMELGD